jgi:acylphosphatase
MHNNITTPMNRRLHAYYSGEVQGVGFRYSAQRAAEPLDITGWVKNLRDGRVELVCEGEKDALDSFLRKIDAMFSSYINNKDVEWTSACGEFEGFDIRF